MSQLFCASTKYRKDGTIQHRKKNPGIVKNSAEEIYFSWEEMDNDFFQENNEYKDNSYNRYNNTPDDRTSYDVGKNTSQRLNNQDARENLYNRQLVYSKDNYKSSYNHVDKSKKISKNRKKQHKSADSHGSNQKALDNTKRGYVLYSVKKRDTLYRISRKFKVPVIKICKLNRISKKTILYVGMRLKIPGEGKSLPGEKRGIEKRAPHFIWPIENILNIRRDGLDGVKAIGIIIEGKPGAFVRTSAPGIVKKIGSMRGFGKYIVIKNKSGYITVYSNLKVINVREGQQVPLGDIIGQISNNENRLHFQINHAGKPKDPLKLLPKI